MFGNTWLIKRCCFLSVGGFLLLAVSLLGTPAYAESTINLNISSESLVLNLAPTRDNGSFAKSSNLNVGVSVNGPGGYTLGISSGDSTALINQSDNTKMMTSISESVSEADFSTNSVVAGDNYNNKWGYLPNKFDSIDNTLFRPAPSNAGDVLDVTRGTNDSGTYTIAIGARADKETTVGTYANTFVITAVSNYSCSVGEICYYDNEADAGIMENQIIPSGAEEIELVGSKYSRRGYGFAGWSPTMLNPDDSNFFEDFAAATVYGPMETVVAPNAGYMELYAVWVPSQGELQQWNGCEDLDVGEVTALTDTRDGNAYAVAKLADGKCWQIENMRLDFSDENLEITNLNTNHPTAYFIEQANTHPGEMSQEIGKEISRYAKKIIYNMDGLKENFTFGNYYGWYTFMAGNYRYGNKDDNLSSIEDLTGGICPSGWRIPFWQDHQSLGNVYDYRLLMSFPSNAVKGGFSDNIGFNVMYPSSDYHAGSGTGTAEFEGLIIDSGRVYAPGYFYGTNTNNGFTVRCLAGDTETYTLSFDANGGTGAPAAQTISNTSGVFSSISTVEPTRNGYTFVGWVDKDGNEVQPGGVYNLGVSNTSMTLYAMWKNNRCNETATTIGTNSLTDAVCLQDINKQVKDAMSAANNNAGSIQTFGLIDARDDKSYDVALLDDGNVWMTKNLNVGTNAQMMLNRYGSDMQNVSFILPESSLFAGFYNGETNDGYYDGVYYGGYYDWAVATASNRVTVHSLDGAFVDSVCPSNWNLPTVNQYTMLLSSASLTSAATATLMPYNFSLGGSYSSSSKQITGQGTSGYFWTSTKGNAAGSSSYASKYILTSSDFYLSGNSSTRSSGNIRCVASNGDVTIRYDGNGSTEYPTRGTMSSEVVDLDGGLTQSNGFVRDGYAFSSWNTLPDGSGIDIAPHADLSTLGLSVGDTITLYAQWTPQFILTYNDNYSNRTFVTKLQPGKSTNLGSYNYFTTKTGYTIKEWNTKADGSGVVYNTGSQLSVPDDLSEPAFLTLYAQWVEDCTITYVNTITGETQTKDVNWNRSTALAAPVTWTYSGYIISGWDVVTNSGIDGNGTAIYFDDQDITLTEDLTIYTVWVPTYTIQYDGNGASSDIGMEVTHTVDASGEITLYANNYKRDGYGFVGWSFDANAANDLDNAVVYGPNATIDVVAPTIAGEVKMLYAVWVKAEANVTMQTFDATVEPYVSYQEGKVIALTDARDNDTYAVAKLADGNWWMIDNLRLGGASSMNLDSTNTDITSAFTLSASSNSIGSSGAPYAINTSNKISAVATMTSANSNIYSYGTYYSWASTVASGSLGWNTTASTSICPRGWHIPSGGSGGEFAQLSLDLGGLATAMNAYTSPTSNDFSRILRNYPNNFSYSGYRNNSSSSGRGTSGFYWTSSSGSRNYAYYMSVANESIIPATSTRGTYGGLSVRCLAD